MKEFNSWRLSRLLDKSAWKRLIHYHMWILLLVFCVILWLCLNNTVPENFERYCTLFWLSVLFFLYFFIDTLLGADEHCEVKLKTTYCNIYVYNRDGRNGVYQDIIFVQDNTEAHITTKSTNLREQGYCFCDNTFRYCLDGDNKKWYYLCEASDDHIFLGKKLVYGRCNVYLREIKKDGTLDLCILHIRRVMHLSADNFVLGDAYVPPLAKKDMQYKALTWRPLEEMVDEYLIISKNGEYKVFGLYFYYLETLRCFELSVPAIIFQDAKDRIILIRENDSYKQLCRKLPATRWINEVIPELSKGYENSNCIGGIVWKFNEQTKTLEKLYEGRYRALGFSDGSIIGDNWEYSPNLNEGKEYKYETEQ